MKDENDEFVFKNGNKVKQLFATDLSRYFGKNIDYWCYGHTHIPYYKKIDNTVLLSNPMGYKPQKTKFNFDCIIDLD